MIATAADAIRAGDLDALRDALRSVPKYALSSLLQLSVYAFAQEATQVLLKAGAIPSHAVLSAAIEQGNTDTAVLLVEADPKCLGPDFHAVGMAFAKALSGDVKAEQCFDAIISKVWRQSEAISAMNRVNKVQAAFVLEKHLARSKSTPARSS